MKKETKKNYTIKITDGDKAAIESLARLHLGGNTSAWVRLAALNWKPSANDLKLPK